MAGIMRGSGVQGPTQGRHLPVAHGPEVLTPAAELAAGVFIHEDYVSLEGTHIIRGVLSIARARVNFTDEGPADSVDAEPLVIFPGFGGGIENGYSRLRHQLARNGRRAVTYKTPRFQAGSTRFHPNYLWTPERLTSQAGYAVARRLLRQPEVKGVHGVGHSMGGPILAEIATRKAGFLSVNLVGSAGLENHNIRKLALRLPGVLRYEIAPAMLELHKEFGLDDAQEAIEYFIRNGWLTMGEIRQVSGVNARPAIQTLGKNDVAVNIFALADDHFFPEAEVHRHSARLPKRYIRVPGNHVKPQLDPAGTVEELLDVIAA